MHPSATYIHAFHLHPHPPWLSSMTATATGDRVPLTGVGGYRPWWWWPPTSSLTCLPRLPACPRMTNRQNGRCGATAVGVAAACGCLTSIGVGRSRGTAGRTWHAAHSGVEDYAAAAAADERLHQPSRRRAPMMTLD